MKVRTRYLRFSFLLFLLFLINETTMTASTPEFAPIALNTFTMVFQVMLLPLSILDI